MVARRHDEKSGSLLYIERADARPAACLDHQTSEPKMSDPTNPPEDSASRLLREFENSPAQRLAREMADSPSARLAREMANSPTARLAREIAESPTAKLAQKMAELPTAKLAREMADSPSAKLARELAESPTGKLARELVLADSGVMATAKKVAALKPITIDTGITRAFAAIKPIEIDPSLAKAIADFKHYELDPGIAKSFAKIEPIEIAPGLAQAISEAQKALTDFGRPYGGLAEAARAIEEQSRTFQKSLVASLGGTVGDVARMNQWASTLGRIASPDIGRLYPNLPTLASEVARLHESTLNALARPTGMDRDRLSAMLGLSYGFSGSIEATRLKMSAFAGVTHMLGAQSRAQNDAYRFALWRLAHAA